MKNKWENKSLTTEGYQPKDLIKKGYQPRERSIVPNTTLADFGVEGRWGGIRSAGMVCLAAWSSGQ